MAQQSSDRNIPHLRDIFGFHHHDSYQSIRDEPPRHRREAEGRKQLKHADSSSAHSGGGNDSAISVGSTSEEELTSMLATSPTKKKKQQRRKEKPLTETDVKHLERHLSMKKTIRKKIMRDLQQAFVEDPDEFRVEDMPREQLKAEINLQSLSFGTAHKKKNGRKTNGESNFLDFLRTGDSKMAAAKQPVLNDDDSGHGSPTRDLSTDRSSHQDDEDDEEETGGRKTSFWRRFTMKGRSKR